MISSYTVASRLLPTLFLVLPISMVISNRSSIIVIAAYSLVALLSNRQQVPMLKVVRYPITIFICLAILAPFSISPLVSLLTAAKIAMIFAISTFVILAFPRNTIRQVLLYATIGLTSSALLILLSTYQIINLDILIGPASFKAVIYNRSVLVLAVIATTLVTLLTAKHRNALSETVLSSVVALLSLILLGFMDSQSAVLYMLAFALCYPLFRLVGGLVDVSKWVIIGLVFTAPIGANLMSNLVPIETGIMTLDRLIFVSNSEARIEIWHAFADAALERPFIGWGLGTERLVQDAANSTNQWLNMNHPHSLTLQVWTNLGVYGACLLGVGIFLLYRWVDDQEPDCVPALAAQVVSLFVVANVSHGAWQSWWLAVLPIPFIVAYLPAGSKDSNVN